MFKFRKKEKKKSDNREKAFLLAERIKSITQMPAYSLEIRKDGYKPTIFDSKLGGLPYWDRGKSYPLDSNGNKMMLLAQINFSKENLNDERLPKQGMLQFFISAADDVYGMDFDEADSQKDFRVIYHEVIDTSISVDDVCALGLPTNLDRAEDMYPPILVEAELIFHRKMAFMGPDVCGFDELFEKVAKEEFGEEVQAKTAYAYLGEDAYSLLCDELYESSVLGNSVDTCGGHWMLGYPYFVQYDPRESTKYYDTLLLQIDSEMVDKEDYVMWGDCGVANFFINAEELKKCNFSKVWYNWDCG